MIGCCVYRHTAPDGRMYIGIAENPKIRWANGKGYKDNPAFWECIQSVGWENIRHEILADGLDSREARRQETELIERCGTLAPNGFNRRRDNPEINSVKHKVEVGRKYGHATVIDYWPDENRMKVYRMRCKCGKEFRCKWFEISEDLSCGCEVI